MNKFALSSVFATVFCLSPICAIADDLTSTLYQMPHSVTLSGGERADAKTYQLLAEHNGVVTTYHLRNTSDQPLQVDEVMLHDWAHGLPDETVFYGEGYTMLSQTGGTLGAMKDIGEYTDRGHYRFEELPGARTVYGMLSLAPPTHGHFVIGFSSCKRFVGKFHVNEQNIKVVVDCENKNLLPGETWELENLFVAEGPDRNTLLDQLADQLTVCHPRLSFHNLPTGWCSWYWFGPGVTADNVVDNLRSISSQAPELRYIQVDDGYQPWMGDWLETGNAFGGDVRDVLAKIQNEDFEPAIWLAPFVASPQSRLFREHPDWFVQDEAGKPLRSDTFTFGGWRLGPWYMLDGTHPEAQQYLEDVFRTMRQEWGCTYFKLDANVWGAMPRGVRHDPKATSVEAYRRGMAAIRRGSGDAFLLGCNHPIWPSIGEIHGSRSSRDIRRSWETFTGLARENLMRNWQNQRLWWNDPDCLVLSGDPSPNEKSFHVVATYASRGMLLSSDDLTKLPVDQFLTLRKCAANPGVAARFDTEWLEIGTIINEQGRFLVLLNWTDEPVDRIVPLESACQLIDFFTGEDLGIHREQFVLKSMPARSGRLLKLDPVE